MWRRWNVGTEHLTIDDGAMCSRVAGACRRNKYIFMETDQSEQLSENRNFTGIASDLGNDGRLS